jgi:hypothetical protein
MSTPQKPTRPTTLADMPAVKVAPAAPRAGAKAGTTQPQQTFLFDKENYMWMIGGIALIFIGFMLMSGGKSANPHEFHYDEIYSFRRVTLSPILILIGFGIEVYAIMKKPKDAAHVVAE